MKKTKIERLLMSLVMRNSNIHLFWNLRKKASACHGLVRLFCIYRYYTYLDRFGASIPLSATIKGHIEFPHGVSGIFVSSDAVIGSGVIYQQVTIGSNRISGSKKPGAPVVGENVVIGAGAKIVGGGSNRRQCSNRCKLCCS